MGSLPLRGWILFAALLAFAIAVLGVVAWARLSGEAGSQRGLVVYNELPVAIEVTLAGQTQRITPDDEETFVVKREQFPARIRWSWGGGEETVADGADLEYQDLVDAEFRVSIDARGVYKTSSYRDTPVPH
jgi:hypothetical protein